MNAPDLAMVSRHTASGAEATILDFTGQRQEQSEWCWAAACASVSSYYHNRKMGKRFRQCEIVQALKFSHRNCCAEPGRCNVQGPMDDGMRFVGHFAGLTDGAVSVATVQEEIDRSHPLAVRVLLATGEEHIVVIYGYGMDSLFHVWNPARGYIRTDMNSWVAHLGWWQNTCLTK